MTQGTDRPALLSLGIALTAIGSLVTMGFIVIAGLLGVLGVTLGLTETQGWDALAVMLVGGVGGALLVVFFLLKLFSLFVCLRAWQLSRGWIWVLIAFSALSVMNAPIGTVIGVITIIGCAQARRARPGAPRGCCASTASGR